MVEDQAKTARPPSYFPVPKYQHSAGRLLSFNGSANLFGFSQFSSGFIVKFIGIAVHDYAAHTFAVSMLMIPSRTWSHTKAPPFQEDRRIPSSREYSNPSFTRFYFHIAFNRAIALTGLRFSQFPPPIPGVPPNSPNGGFEHPSPVLWHAIGVSRSYFIYAGASHCFTMTHRIGLYFMMIRHNRIKSSDISALIIFNPPIPEEVIIRGQPSAFWTPHHRILIEKHSRPFLFLFSALVDPGNKGNGSLHNRQKTFQVPLVRFHTTLL